MADDIASGAFSRASTAWYFDSTGTLQSAASNVLRFDYGAAPAATGTPLFETTPRTNGIRNSSNTGAVIGSPGTLPTNWAGGSFAGGTISVVATGTDAGLPYVDLRFQGTPVLSQNQNITFEGNTNIAAASGQAWTVSMFWKLVAGSLPSGIQAFWDVKERTSGGAAVQTDSSSALTLPGAAGLATQRPKFTATLSGATTANVTPQIRFLYAAGAIDFTIRFAVVQLEQGSSASSPIPTTSAAITRAADAGPVIGYPTAVGAAKQEYLATGTGLLGTMTASGTAASSNSASGTGLLGAMTASGAAAQGFTASAGFSRPSVASYFDASGVLQSAAPNVLRMTFGSAPETTAKPLLEGFATNVLRNNTMLGAVVGSPGTLPTNYAVSSGVPAGTISVAGFGTEDGVPYIDVRFAGNATNGSGQGVSFEPNLNGIAALTGQNWTGSLYTRVIAGAIPVGTTMALQFLERSSAGGAVLTTSIAATLPTAARLATQRQSFPVTLSGGATTAWLVPLLRFTYPTAAVDMTIRIGAPQVEAGSTRTSLILTSGTAASRAADSGPLIGYPSTAGTAFQEDIASGAGLFGAVIAAGVASQDDFAHGTGLFGAITGSGAGANALVINLASGTTTIGPAGAAGVAIQEDIASGTGLLSPFFGGSQNARQEILGQGRGRFAAFLAVGVVAAAQPPVTPAWQIPTSQVDDTVVRRFADAVERKGVQGVLRRIGYLGGASGNPPMLDFPVIDGNFAIGAVEISIRAQAAEGRLVAGDRLMLQGLPGALVVEAENVARGPGYDPANPVVPGFDQVQLTVPLTAPIADGALITPCWIADQPVWFMESDFSLREQSDQILEGDLSVSIAAFGVARPNALDVLLVDGFARSIVNVARKTVRGQTVAWIVQAR
jgi:hypothetical protein